MKNIIKYILVISLIALWSFSYADGKITNGSKVKVKPGTHFIEKGSLNIIDNGQLIIEGMLTVDGSLINNTSFDGLQIKSDYYNTGSIIYQSGSPMAMVERFMKSKRSHYIGSPVNGASAEVLDFDNTSTYLYEYVDGSGLNAINNNSTELINAKGYYYRISPSGSSGLTPQFEGSLTANDLDLNSNSTPPLEFLYKGSTMIANPYASAIDWENPNIALNDMEASIWIYDANTRKIKYRNQSGYGTLQDGIIPMGQAFMVRTYSEEATLYIPAEARLHSQKDFYKNSEEVLDDLDYLILELQKDTLKDEIWVGYQWNSTDDMDNGIDISKMFTFEEEPQIYTSHNEEDFTIDLIAKPEESNKQIPVFIRVVSDGMHQLNLTDYQGFFDMNVYLEDLQSGEMIDMEEMDYYEFNATTNDDELRFIIHFNPLNPTNTHDFSSNEKQVQIYAYGDQIYIKSEGEYAAQSKKVFLYDLNGKLLTEIILSQGFLTSIKNRFKRKMIVVKAKYPSDTFTEKVIYIK